MKWIIGLLIFFNFSFANSCENKLFSISTKDNSGIALETIINNISDVCNINVIFEDDLAKDKISKRLKYLKLKNLPLKDFLKEIFDKAGYFWELKDDNLYLSYIKTKNFKIDYVNSSSSGVSSLSTSVSTIDGSTEGDHTINSSFDFNFWNSFSTNLKDFLKNQVTDEFKMPDPIIDKITGLVTVKGTKKELNEVKKYIDEVNNRLHKQVFLDVRIYSVSLSKSHQSGVNWSDFGMSMDTGLVSTASNVGTTILSSPAFKLNGVLNFLSKYGQVNSISNPKITTLNNQKAIITVGETVNYSYNKETTTNGTTTTIPIPGQQFVGILLDIIPQISDNNIIIMRISPSISSISKINTNLPPDTIDKKLNTIVRVKDGDTIILGGLITNENSLNSVGVPVLKEVPILKYLFSAKEQISSRKELVFVITPHLIDLTKKNKVKDFGFKLPKLGSF